MKDPKIEAIELTDQEREDAIYEGKVKKHHHLRSIKNGVSWHTKNTRFGKSVNEFLERYIIKA